MQFCFLQTKWASSGCHRQPLAMSFIFIGFVSQKRIHKEVKIFLLFCFFCCCCLSLVLFRLFVCLFAFFVGPGGGDGISSRASI